MGISRRDVNSRLGWLGMGLLAIVLLGLLAVQGCTPSPLPESEIISKQGIHWHVELSITTLGQKQDIPANVGIGVAEHSIHTHEANNVIHLEFTGLVKKDDIRLGRFFEIWDKKFSQNCIFTKCNGPEGKVKMFVNREPNFQFENYIMRDKNKIQIFFEK
jgi:hypothetical protein